MAHTIPSVLSLENEVFRSFLFCSTILILKMMFMAVFTASKRMKYKAYANPEDSKTFQAKPKTDENVERVRRAHLNDLENIPLFFVAGLLFTLTNPAAFLAKSLFLAYTVSRILHTFVYAVLPFPQPTRRSIYFFGSFITGSMTAFVNPEDAIHAHREPRTEEKVERVRRAHLNDLENIPLFFIAGFLYILTNPAAKVAKSLFLAYTIARVVHTFVYAVWPLPQPARGLSWIVGYLITGFMAVRGLIYFV